MLNVFVPIMALLTLAASGSGESGREQKKQTDVAEFIGKLLTPAPTDDELRKLQIERYNAAHLELAGIWGNVAAGKLSFHAMVEPSRRLVHSELELYQQPAEKIIARERHLTLLKEVERLTKGAWTAGVVPSFEYHQIRYLRLDAEIELLRAKRQAKAKK